jgi:hypothetical protein
VRQRVTSNIISSVCARAPHQTSSVCVCGWVGGWVGASHGLYAQGVCACSSHQKSNVFVCVCVLRVCVFVCACVLLLACHVKYHVNLTWNALIALGFSGARNRFVKSTKAGQGHTHTHTVDIEVNTTRDSYTHNPASSCSQGLS